MNYRNYSKHVNDKGVDINISPLIDVAFLLLIFFFVTTVFAEETGVEIQKPKAASATDLEKKSMLIALSADGDIVYGGRRVDLNGVRGMRPAAPETRSPHHPHWG